MSASESVRATRHSSPQCGCGTILCHPSRGRQGAEKPRVGKKRGGGTVVPPPPHSSPCLERLGLELELSGRRRAVFDFNLLLDRLALVQSCMPRHQLVL